MRLPTRSALGALLLGIVAALAAGEGVVRLAARWSPAVRDLAVPGGGRREPRTFASLAAYLASQPTQVIPHRNWFNYWSNALGLNDEEFEVPKPAGRFRILALGDSFTFGLVPYPHGVMTLLEARLRAACPGRQLDLLNFGIGGAGVGDYRAIVTLGLTTYDPDLVLVNFYAGNDAPDLYREVHERSRGPTLGASRLWTLGRKALRLWRGVHDLDAVQAPPAGPAPPGHTPRGGAPVDPRRHVSSEIPPSRARSSRRPCSPRSRPRSCGGSTAPRIPRSWSAPGSPCSPTWRRSARRSSGRAAAWRWPSTPRRSRSIPEQRAALVETLRRRPRYAALSADALDPALPNRQLAAYCQRAALRCVDLTPVFVEASRASAEPLYKQRDAHWTIRGNQVAADAEAEFLAGLVCPAGAPAPSPAPR